MYVLELLIKNRYNNYKYLEKIFFIKFLCENKIVKHCKSLLNKLKHDPEYKKLLKELFELKKALEKQQLEKNKAEEIKNKKKKIEYKKK